MWTIPEAIYTTCSAYTNKHSSSREKEWLLYVHIKACARFLGADGGRSVQTRDHRTPPAPRTNIGFTV